MKRLHATPDEKPLFELARSVNMPPSTARDRCIRLQVGRQEKILGRNAWFVTPSEWQQIVSYVQKGRSK